MGFFRNRNRDQIRRLEEALAEANRRIAALGRQVADLLREHQRLTAENAALQQENAALKHENVQLKKQVLELTEKVAQLSKTSRNSSKPPSSDITKPPGSNGGTGGGNGRKRNRPGGQPGHAGANHAPFPPDKIDQTTDLFPEACACGCREGIPLPEPQVFQTVELPAAPVVINEVRIHGRTCAQCGKVVWAAWPEGFVPGQLFGPRLQSLMGYLKGRLHASYTSLQDFCRDLLGFAIARSHLCNTIGRVNQALAVPYQELAEHIPSEPVVNVDESGWKDRGLTYWIWLFATPFVSFFAIAKSRSSQVLRNVLGRAYQGTVVSDFFGAYVKYANRLQQFCLAHLIRDIKFLTTLPRKKDQVFGRALLRQFRRLFHFWHLRETIPKEEFDRKLFRIRKRILLLAECPRLPPKSAALARRLRKHGAAIFRFLFDPAVPPTNNEAERSLRQVVIDRKITQGSRSQKGREWNERIWTVLDTCRKQHRSAWQFLQDALSAYHFHTPYPSLLPNKP